jgi:hypothetical protein
MVPKRKVPEPLPDSSSRRAEQHGRVVVDVVVELVTMAVVMVVVDVTIADSSVATSSTKASIFASTTAASPVVAQLPLASLLANRFAKDVSHAATLRESISPPLEACRASRCSLQAIFFAAAAILAP